MPKFRITIVADDPLVRAGLAAMLLTRSALTAVAQFSSTEILQELEEDALELVDALIWDVGWDGAEVSFDWHSFPCPVVALVPEDSPRALLWQSGAHALLRRDATAVQIETAVQASLENLHTFDPTIHSDLFTSTQTELLEINEALTPRETEVIQLIAEGMTNKAIAQQLEISNHTVKFHVTAIMTKLKAQSRTNAVVRATRLGLISL